MAPVIKVVVMPPRVVARRDAATPEDSQCHPAPGAPSSTAWTRDDLAGCLRTWRDRLDPAEAGLPASSRRRAPGLRREEVAQLAGLSVDYLARLEQGRASAPSPSVLAPLARALRLSEDERDHLFRVAGQAPPGAGRIDRHITPSIQRVLDRLQDVPVLVVDAAWQPIAKNALAKALLGDGPTRTSCGATSAARPARVVRDARGDRADGGAGRRRSARRRRPLPRRRAAARADRRAARARARASRRSGSSVPWPATVADRKTFEHPEVGRITLDCDELTVGGSDLRLVVHTAPPGSPDAQALALLATIGLQTF